MICFLYKDIDNSIDMREHRGHSLFANKSVNWWLKLIMSH